MRLPTVTSEDVQAVVAGVGGAGTYLAADLYAAYVRYAEERGDPPVSAIVWGRALGRSGGQRKMRTVNGKRVPVWLV